MDSIHQASDSCILQVSSEEICLQQASSQVRMQALKAMQHPAAAGYTWPSSPPAPLQLQREFSWQPQLERCKLPCQQMLLLLLLPCLTLLPS
jgi:hypothetical protein